MPIAELRRALFGKEIAVLSIHLRLVPSLVSTLTRFGYTFVTLIQTLAAQRLSASVISFWTTAQCTGPRSNRRETWRPPNKSEAAGFRIPR